MMRRQRNADGNRRPSASNSIAQRTFARSRARAAGWDGDARNHAPERHRGGDVRQLTLMRAFTDTCRVTNILVCAFAVLLCLINAVVWTFVSDMPLAGIGWIIAATACVFLQRWSRY